MVKQGGGRIASQCCWGWWGLWQVVPRAVCGGDGAGSEGLDECGLREGMCRYRLGWGAEKLGVQERKACWGREGRMLGSRLGSQHPEQDDGRITPSFCKVGESSIPTQTQFPLPARETQLTSLRWSVASVAKVPSSSWAGGQ